MMSLIDKLKENSTAIKLTLLICLFGTGSWVEINGIWVELPLLVLESPQQWALPSYLTVIIQLANIGPILYFLANRYVKRNGQKVVTEIPVIYGILGVGVLASVLLAFFWNKTTSIGGTSYSTALIVLSFFLATVDCTSSLTFLPFMSYFPQQYMTAFYVGEGMSGFLPSIVALIQGVGKKPYTCQNQVAWQNITAPQNITGTLVPTAAELTNVTKIVPKYFLVEPLFSTTVFFIFISIMMAGSLTSFAFLVRWKKQQVSTSTTGYGSNGSLILTKAAEVESSSSIDAKGITSTRLESPDNLNKETQRSPVIYYLFVMALMNGLGNGVLPAIQSYACIPYGFNIYHLTLALSALANPLACFLYFFVSIESTVVISVGVVLYIVSAGYIIWMAALSPCPVLIHSSGGGIIILLVTIFGVGLVSYLKTAISSVLRKHGYKQLFWCGISVQVGSLIGALTVFPLVNIYGTFKQSEPCYVCNRTM